MRVPCPESIGESLPLLQYAVGINGIALHAVVLQIVGGDFTGRVYERCEGRVFGRDRVPNGDQRTPHLNLRLADEVAIECNFFGRGVALRHGGVSHDEREVSLLVSIRRDGEELRRFVGLILWREVGGFVACIRVDT